MFSNSEIIDILRAQLEEATRKHEEAKRNFSEVSSEIPSGIPHPDGSQRMHNATSVQNVTREKLYQALKRFNAYLIDGTLPDDLRTEFKKADGFRKKES